MMIRSVSPHPVRQTAYVANTNKAQQAFNQQVGFGMCPLCVGAATAGFASVFGGIPLLGRLFKRKPKPTPDNAPATNPPNSSPPLPSCCSGKETKKDAGI